MTIKLILLSVTLAISSIAFSQEAKLKTTDIELNKNSSSIPTQFSISLSVTPPFESIENPQLRSNQAWLNSSIYELSFWKIEQKFLGMTLCEPIDFEWETWGDNKYSDLNRLVQKQEYQRFLSQNR